MDINIFKTQKKFQKTNLNKKPYFFWNIILIVMTILIALAFIFGYYIFRQTNQEFILPEDELGGQIEIVSTGRLDGVLKYFDQKEKKSNEVLNSSELIVDPSL